MSKNLDLKNTSKEQISAVIWQYIKMAGNSKKSCRYFYLQDKYHEKPTIISSGYEKRANWFFQITNNWTYKDEGVVIYWNDDETGKAFSSREEVAEKLWEYIKEVY